MHTMDRLPRAVAALSALFLASGIGVAAAAAPAAAQAADTSAAYCTFTAHFALSPGVTLAPDAFSFTSLGDTPIHCTGEVAGATVTGPGHVVEHGVIDRGNCAAGTGHGTYHVTVPTTDGRQDIQGGFDITYLALTGSETGPRINASFTYIPAEGTCLLTPLTGFVLEQHEQLRTMPRA